MMACTPEEIEQKRRQAQQKLASKLNGYRGPLKPSSSGNGGDNFQNFANRMNQHSANSISHNSSTGFNSPGQVKHHPKPYDKPKQAVPFYGTENLTKLTFNLISDERFAVDMSSFSTPVVDLFKTIPSRSYDPHTRVWSFHFKDYEALISKLSFMKQGVCIFEKLPNFVVNLLRQSKRDYLNTDLSKIDPVLLSSLMPFQQEGVCFGIDKRGRCLIADDMGLGKTFQALGVASYYREDWPLLIVTTASMKNVWESTIHNYLPSVPIMQTQYMVSAKDYIAESMVLIVSHDMMSRSVDRLLERNFGVLIIDESHNLKNFKAKCTKAATLLSKKATRVILLSGTPALSRPSELFTQLSLLNDKFFGSFFEYSKRYCDGKTTNFGWDASGKSNLAELEIVLARKFMIRRTKDEVLKAMPNKTREVVTLDVKLQQFSKEEQHILNSLAERYNNGVKPSERHALLLTFFAETAKIKIPSVCSYVLQMLNEDRKFLVFAHHRVMLDAIENILKQKNKNYIRIDGSTTSDQRKYFVDKFQMDDKCVCAVLSITAANAGITLTAAQLVLFAELHWNPSILSQAESRAHRIGQNCVVVVRYLIAPGTADDSIWPMLQEKQKILGEVGLLKDCFTNVTIKKQDKKAKDHVTEGLRMDVTVANTMDIKRYFKLNNSIQDTSLSDSDGSANGSRHNDTVNDDSCDVFNDGLDELFTDDKLDDVFNDGFDDVLSKLDV